MPSKYRRSCNECQRRHLKCDLSNPCKACSQAGRDCVEASRYHFRHEEGPTGPRKKKRKVTTGFDEDQEWAKIPKQLHFVDESKQASASSIEGSERVAETSNTELQEEPLADAAFDVEVLSDPTNISTRHSAMTSSLEGHHLLNGPSSVVVSDSWHAPSPSSYPGLWPVSTQEEAQLIRYFLTELSSWFDFVDPHRHFSTTVLIEASHSPTLHYAILAVSSRHLSLTSPTSVYYKNSVIPDHYQHKCLKTLIPALKDPDALLDEGLFAARVILRLFDEMTERPGFGGHVLRSDMMIDFLKTKSPSSMPASTLRRASLLIELRQEIYIAFISNRTPAQLVEYCEIDRCLEKADDWTWTERMLALTSDVLTYCNGDGIKSQHQWTELMEQLDAWENGTNSTFTPFYQESENLEAGRCWPGIWFANDCHAAGKQYLAISRIVMLANDPHIPRLGTGRIRALENIDAQIKSQVLLACGIATSNRQFFVMMIAAGGAIDMCGERFTDRRQQEAFIRILEETEAHVAWPNHRYRERLKVIWGWDSQ